MSFLALFSISLAGGLYVFAIAYAANMAPIPAAKAFARWNKPIWEKRLGGNKTWLGTIGGLLAGMIVAYGEHELNRRLAVPERLHLENLYVLPWPILGLLVASGALIVGDMGKSAIKRQFNIKPGAPWKPFDDIDASVGTALVIAPFLWQHPWTIVAGVLIGYLANPIVNKLSHRAGIKSVPY